MLKVNGYDLAVIKTSEFNEKSADVNRLDVVSWHVLHYFEIYHFLRIFVKDVSTKWDSIGLT